MTTQEIDQKKIKELFMLIHKHYGYDFSNYASASINRRIINFMQEKNFNKIDNLLDEISHNESIFNDLLNKISVSVTEMFRDPSFFISINNSIIAWLKTWPFIKIWHAGCSTGEEVYSMAILLKRAKLLSKSQIYATDINENSLNIARNAIYPESLYSDYANNFKNICPNDDLENYCHKKYNSFIINNEIKEKVFFAQHNLVTDGMFSEMNLIVCRNVLIYFNNDLKNRVMNLFCDSLAPNGLLCLGLRESIYHTNSKFSFESLISEHKIYRKII